MMVLNKQPAKRLASIWVRVAVHHMRMARRILGSDDTAALWIEADVLLGQLRDFARRLRE